MRAVQALPAWLAALCGLCDKRSMDPMPPIPPPAAPVWPDRRQMLGLIGLAIASADGASAQNVAPQRPGLVSMRATFGERGQDIPGDLVWRVYAVRGTEAQFVNRSEVPRPNFVLPPGLYAIHVSYGLATAMRQLTVTDTTQSGAVPLNAGALQVSGYLGIPERPLAPARQTLRLFIPTANNSEGKLVTDALRPGTVGHPGG